MRYLKLLFALCSSLCNGATSIVCTTMTALHDGRNCTTTDARTAIQSAAPGDTVILRAGDTFNISSNITLPGNNGTGWITIESSRADELRPGYRVTPADAAAGKLATIAFASNAGIITVPLPRFYSANAATDTITSNGHGFQNGDEVAYTANHDQHILCYGDNLPSINGVCSGRAGYIVKRFGSSSLTDGAPIWVFGKRLPIELTHGGLYYMRDVMNGGPGNYIYRLAASPGGTAINYSGPAEGFMREFGIYPIRHNQSYFVRDRTANTFKLAYARGGSAIDLQVSHSTGWFAKVERAQNYRFRGLEMKPQARSTVGYPGGLYGLHANHFGSLPKQFVFEHCYWHGNFNEDGPAQGMRFDGDGLVIRDSRCDEIKSLYDSQCLLQITSPGNVLLENVHFEAGGENYMAGGAHPYIREIQPNNVRIVRGYFPKAWYWWYGAKYNTSGLTNAFRLRSRYRAQHCDVAYNSSPAQQCFGYTKDGARAVLQQDTLFSGISGDGSLILGIANDGTWIVRHTNGVTVASCASEFTCTREAGETINWPADAPQWFRINVVGGAPTPCASTGLHECGTFNALNTNTGGRLMRWVTKNNWEIKAGSNYFAHGVVMANKWFDDTGQSQGPTLHPQGTSGESEIAYWVSVKDTLWQNSIFADLVSAFSLQGRTNLGGRPEATLKDVGGRHTIHNNLFVGNSNALLGKYSIQWMNADFDINSTIRNDTKHTRVTHNTVVDAELSFLRFGSPDAVMNCGKDCDTNYSVHTDNVVIPMLRPSTTATFPNVIGPGAGGVCDLAAYGRNANGVWDKTILMNRNGGMSNYDDVGSCGTGGADYPSGTTFMVNGTQNLVSTLFTSWNEHTCEMLFDTKCVSRDSTTDLRIADPDYKAGGVNQGTDGRDLGADIDEIEAETGPWGVDVIAGIPPFRERSGRTVSAGSTSAVVSYAPLSADRCRVKIWENPRYSGAPAVDTDDSGADVLGGRRTLRITGLNPSVTYYAKRRCGTGVDVFSFATLAANGARSIQVNGAFVPAASAVIESGVSPESLAAGAPVACTAGCALTIPSEHGYYRVAYRDSSGVTIARSDVIAAP